MMEIGSPSWKELIQAGARSMSIDLDAGKLEQFALHAVELIRWNRKTNLTSITEPAAVAVGHFLDSIAPAPLIPEGAAMLDIGSGGGFPGIPLKVLRPDLKVTLIDSIRKKVSFQKHVIRTLDLQRIRSLQVRAERLSGDIFEVVITRALATLPDFVALALPLLAPGGLMIALKGAPAEAQREVERLLDGEGDRLSVELSTYRLPGISGERTIVAIKRA